MNQKEKWALFLSQMLVTRLENQEKALGHLVCHSSVNQEEVHYVFKHQVQGG
jgi:hypothetical protein